MKIASHISWQKLINRIYIIDEEKDSILKIEDIAAEIWMMISDGLDYEEIINNIFQNYEVSIEEVSSDVMCFINEMVEKGYLVK